MEKHADVPAQPLVRPPFHQAAVVQDDPEALPLQATLDQILISAGHDYWVKAGTPTDLHGIRSVKSVRCVEGRGLEGDRYFHGRATRLGQVTFIAAETIDAVRERFGLPDLSASLFRRNLVVRGAELSSLLGRQFVFQGVTFRGSQECKPCVWMDRKIANGVQAFLRESFRGGLRAQVLSTGWLTADSE